jgi:hypothetical protein
VLTQGALECGAAVHRFGGVVSHLAIIIPS